MSDKRTNGVSEVSLDNYRVLPTPDCCQVCQNVVAPHSFIGCSLYPLNDGRLGYHSVNVNGICDRFVRHRLAGGIE